MKINLNDLDFIDGKYSYTFTPSEDLPSIQLESDCLGDLKLNHIQVENNSTATDFVAPMVYDEPLSGVFKDIKELRLEMTDVDNSNLWSMIRLNSEQMLMQYHENEFKTALNQTARYLTALLEDKDNLARLVMTAERFNNLMTSRDGKIKSQFDQLSDTFSTRIENLEDDTNSQFIQLSRGFKTTVDDLREERSTALKQLSSGFEATVSDYQSDTEAKIIQLSNGIDQTIKDYQSETETRISQLSSGFNQTVRNYKNGTDSQITQLSNLINQKVSAGQVETIIGQSGDKIWLQIKDKVQTTTSGSKMTGDEIITAINLATGYAKVKSDKIILDGNTYMTNAFAKNLLTNKLTANDVSAFSATFNKVIASNLNINYLTGNYAQLIQAMFNGKNSKVKIDGGGMQVLRNDGSYSTAFTDNGIDIFRGADKVGAIQSIDAPDIDGYFKGRKSISITAQPESYLSLDYAMLDGTTDSALTLGGDGRMRVHSPFYAGDTNNGFEINISTVKSLKSASTVLTVDNVIWEGEVPVDVSAGLQIYNDFGWEKARRAKYVEVDGIRFTIKSLSQAIGNYIQFNVEEPMSGYPSSKPKVRLLGEPIKQDKPGEYETIRGSAFRDVNTAGGFLINDNRDMWVSTSGQQQWISITQMQRDLQALKNSVDGLSKSSGGTGWNGRGYEPTAGGAPYYKDTSSTGGKENITTEKVKTIRVGDYVNIRSGVTHYYHDDGRYLRIYPGYESKTFRVAQIVNGKSGGTHLLMIGGNRIAWINSSDIYKV